MEEATSELFENRAILLHTALLRVVSDSIMSLESTVQVTTWIRAKGLLNEYSVPLPSPPSVCQIIELQRTPAGHRLFLGQLKATQFTLCCLQLISSGQEFFLRQLTAYSHHSILSEWDRGQVDPTHFGAFNRHL